MLFYFRSFLLFLFCKRGYLLYSLTWLITSESVLHIMVVEAYSLLFILKRRSKYTHTHTCICVCIKRVGGTVAMVCICLYLHPPKKKKSNTSYLNLPDKCSLSTIAIFLRSASSQRKEKNPRLPLCFRNPRNFRTPRSFRESN